MSDEEINKLVRGLIVLGKTNNRRFMLARAKTDGSVVFVDVTTEVWIVVPQADLQELVKAILSLVA